MLPREIHLDRCSVWGPRSYPGLQPLCEEAFNTIPVGRVGPSNEETQMTVLEEILLLSMGSQPICNSSLTHIHSPRGLAPVPYDVNAFKEPEVSVVEVHR